MAGIPIPKAPMTPKRIKSLRHASTKSVYSAPRQYRARRPLQSIWGNYVQPQSPSEAEKSRTFSLMVCRGLSLISHRLTTIENRTAPLTAHDKKRRFSAPKGTPQWEHEHYFKEVNNQSRRNCLL